jgi:succinylglutamate desuccinylase
MDQAFLTTGFLSLCLQNDSSVKAGTRFTINTSTCATIYALGVIEFSPKNRQDGAKSIVLSCGIHGNETGPIELCDRLVDDIITGRVLPLHRVLFIFGNLEAMKIEKRFVDENLNRLFCGEYKNASKSNEETRRAAELEHCVQRFFADASEASVRLHYDLHTAIRASKHERFAVYPYLHGGAYSHSQFSFMARCGVKAFLLSQSTTATFRYYSSKTFGAHSFTVELGKVKPFGQNDMANFSEVDSALRAVLVEQDLPQCDPIDDIVVYSVKKVIIKKSEQLKLNFSNDAQNFTAFKKGELIASDDSYRYLADQDGEAIVFPNANVPIGQRALLTVVPISTDSLSMGK